MSPGSGPVIVGVDVGGTKVLAGVVDDTGRVVRTARRSTPGRRVEVALVEGALDDAVREAAAGEPLGGVGVAAAGFVDADGESVRFAPHLPWQGERVRARLARRWGVPVILDNDANAALWAETVYGAARGSRHTVMITLGTGIGGAVVQEDRVLRGVNGMAGEFGHMQVVPAGLPCECGGSGCWEQYCSGNALLRYVRSRIGHEASALEDACGGDPDRLTGPAVTEAATRGDPLAVAAFGSVGDWLGVGLANLVAALDPERLVVGGGLSAAGELLLGPARATLARSLVAAPHRVVPPVVPALLGPAAGLVGAATLARQAVSRR